MAAGIRHNYLRQALAARRVRQANTRIDGATVNLPCLIPTTATESAKGHQRVILWMFLFFVVLWIVAPVYEQFRIRSKEILGTVTEIEKAVSAEHNKASSERWLA